jgi:hypothetical protein
MRKNFRKLFMNFSQSRFSKLSQAVASIAFFVLGSLVGFNKDEGFQIGKTKTDPMGTGIKQIGSLKFGMPQAFAACGAGMGCSGGYGMCGAGMGCGGQGSGGMGACGAGMGCSGGGGACGAGMGCGGQ